jgi:hypothetical protein
MELVLASVQSPLLVKIFPPQKTLIIVSCFVLPALPRIVQPFFNISPLPP